MLDVIKFAALIAFFAWQGRRAQQKRQDEADEANWRECMGDGPRPGQVAREVNGDVLWVTPYPRKATDSWKK
jgi:hypothetical protein